MFERVKTEGTLVVFNLSYTYLFCNIDKLSKTQCIYTFKFKQPKNILLLRIFLCNELRRNNCILFKTKCMTIYMMVQQITFRAVVNHYTKQCLKYLCLWAYFDSTLVWRGKNVGLSTESKQQSSSEKRAQLKQASGGITQTLEYRVWRTTSKPGVGQHEPSYLPQKLFRAVTMKSETAPSEESMKYEKHLVEPIWLFTLNIKHLFIYFSNTYSCMINIVFNLNSF